MKDRPHRALCSPYTTKEAGKELSWILPDGPLPLRPKATLQIRVPRSAPTSRHAFIFPLPLSLTCLTRRRRRLQGFRGLRGRTRPPRSPSSCRTRTHLLVTQVASADNGLLRGAQVQSRCLSVNPTYTILVASRALSLSLSLRPSVCLSVSPSSHSLLLLMPPLFPAVASHRAWWTAGGEGEPLYEYSGGGLSRSLDFAIAAAARALSLSLSRTKPNGRRRDAAAAADCQPSSPLP